MSIWFKKNRPTDDEFRGLTGKHQTVLSLLDISIAEIGDDFLTLSMPVDSRHVQPYRLLHGGVSMVLVESAASIAASLCLDETKHRAVGIEINGNHLRGVQEGDGTVTATATPLHIGRSTHVWRVVINNDQGKQVCEGRMTAQVLDLKKKSKT